MKVTNNTEGDRVYPTLGITLKAGESHDTDGKKQTAKPVVAATTEEPKTESSAASDSKLGE